MARPEPADVRMRIDLALGAVDEVTERVEEVIRQEAKPSADEFATDVYRLLGRLAEGTGNLATSMRLITEAEEQG